VDITKFRKPKDWINYRNKFFWENKNESRNEMLEEKVRKHTA